MLVPFSRKLLSKEWHRMWLIGALLFIKALITDQTS